MRNSAIALGLLCGAGCGDSGFGPEDPSFLVITEIELTNITDVQLFNDLLEVEVHLYDAHTGLFLGCSGQDSGLREVEVAEVRYSVQGYFQKPPDGSEALTVDEIRGRDLYVDVVEDDSDACPIPTNVATREWDDPIGTSGLFSAADLVPPLALQFGDVVRIVLGTTQSPY